MKYKYILIIIITIEIVYISFSLFYPTQKQIQGIEKLFPSPTPTPNPSTTPRAYNQTILDNVANLSKLFTVSAILKNEYQGTIVDIQLSQNPSVIYPLNLQIRGSQEYQNTFLFTQKDMKNLKIFQILNNKKIPISFNTLKAGDQITIYEELDLKKTWPDTRQVVVITKK